MDMSGFLLPIREVPDVPWNPHLVPTTGDLGEPQPEEPDRLRLQHDYGMNSRPTPL